MPKRHLRVSTPRDMKFLNMQSARPMEIRGFPPDYLEHVLLENRRVASPQ